jgi:hypothetical protein
MRTGRRKRRRGLLTMRRELSQRVTKKVSNMASICKDIPIHAHPDAVWEAVRDFGAVHQRLNPGFVVDCRLDGNARIVTFHNGNVVREEFVDCDDTRRRLAYAITGRERVNHYNGSVQVLGDGDNRSRIIWIVDVLPNEIAPYISEQMDLAAVAMQKTLGSA